MDFYTQYEFNLYEIPLPVELQTLLSKQTQQNITDKFHTQLGTGGLELISVVAHKLTDGHRITIHNDFIGSEESHRFVIHFTPLWTEVNGGYLMVFGSSKVDEVKEIFAPLNNFGFGFEISNKSYHAVSTVRNFNRYTLVYTFRRPHESGLNS